MLGNPDLIDTTKNLLHTSHHKGRIQRIKEANRVDITLLTAVAPLIIAISFAYLNFIVGSFETFVMRVLAGVFLGIGVGMLGGEVLGSKTDNRRSKQEATSNESE